MDRMQTWSLDNIGLCAGTPDSVNWLEDTLRLLLANFPTHRFKIEGASILRGLRLIEFDRAMMNLLKHVFHATAAGTTIILLADEKCISFFCDGLDDGDDGGTADAANEAAILRQRIRRGWHSEPSLRFVIDWCAQHGARLQVPSTAASASTVSSPSTSAPLSSPSARLLPNISEPAARVIRLLTLHLPPSSFHSPQT